MSLLIMGRDMPAIDLAVAVPGFMLIGVVGGLDRGLIRSMSEW